MKTVLLPKSGIDYIVEQIYRGRFISVEETKQIFVNGINDYRSKIIDSPYLADISSKLLMSLTTLKKFIRKIWS